MRCRVSRRTSLNYYSRPPTPPLLTHIQTQKEWRAGLLVGKRGLLGSVARWTSRLLIPRSRRARLSNQLSNPLPPTRPSDLVRAAGSLCSGPSADQHLRNRWENSTPNERILYFTDGVLTFCRRPRAGRPGCTPPRTQTAGWCRD